MAGVRGATRVVAAMRPVRPVRPVLGEVQRRVEARRYQEQRGALFRLVLGTAQGPLDRARERRPRGFCALEDGEDHRAEQDER